MTLSFSIPAHNESKNINACLEAIRREAAVAEVAVEIVVIDNASQDDTALVAQKVPGVRVVREEQKGLLFARQRGFRETTGELIANIDADTLLTSGWIKKVLQEFESDPKLVALSGPYIYHDLSWWPRFVTKLFYGVAYGIHAVAHLFLGKAALLQGGNFIVRRSALEAIGGFNTNLSFYGEDTDIAKRISVMGKVKFSFDLPALTSGRRLAKEGVFLTGWRYAINHFWVIFFDRPFTASYEDVRGDSQHVQK
ncbi:MAG: glycosyltransferase family 2 protein [Anaplasmataceae bacterium]|nr:glycosyltransferase family 2 protein [Anaplasmataceae bacterium]